MNLDWLKKEIGVAAVLIPAVAVQGGFFYWISPGARPTIEWSSALIEALLFLFVLIWNLAILPQWRAAKLLCLGSLLFLIGTLADVSDNFFIQPRWGDWLVEDLSLALGAALMAVGIRSWVREKNRLLAQFQRERDFEASLIPKLFHDLRVPLSNMMGMTDIAQGDPKFLEDSGRRREYFDIVMRAANDMYFLIDNVLETYRIKSETLRLSPASTSLTALLDESLKDFHYQARKKQIGLTTDFPATDVELTADRVKIVRVIQNLLANAIKFSPRGGRIVLKARAQDDRITIRVMDEGPGVPQELLAPLFDETAAAPPRESEEADAEGFGLGLKVVREFVRLHGGRFWIEPNTPHGAQFCFTVPQRQPRPA